jgi:hypothetical protein
MVTFSFCGFLRVESVEAPLREGIARGRPAPREPTAHLGARASIRSKELKFTRIREETGREVTTLTVGARAPTREL